MQTERGLKEDLRVLRIDRQQASRRERSYRKPALKIAAATVLLAVSLFVLMRLKFDSGLNLGNKRVRLTTAARRSTDGRQPVLSAGGYIIARNQVEVASKITGRVVSLEVKEGDLVRQNQVIARLDDYEVRAQVQQAEASLQAAHARLSQLEAGSREQEIERARAQMERAKADLNNAELSRQRAERLVREGVLQQQALDDARARHEIALKTYQAAVEDYDLVRAGPRREEIELARAQAQQAAASLAYAKAQMENTIIRAPVTGTILDRYVDLGEMVTTGFASERGARQALVTLADLNDLQVELDITEADIAKVKLGQPVVITPDAYSDRHYQGVVEYIAGVARREKATIQTKVKVLNPDSFLRPDQGAQVTFYPAGAGAPQREAPVMLPRSAIVNLDGRTVVFLARDGKAVPQSVSVGQERDGYVEILSGLRGGESVIISGQAEMSEGEKIEVEP